MAKGYWVVHVDVENADVYATYQSFVRPFLMANGGKFLVRGGQHNVVEGQARARTVIIEFASFAEATSVYHSEAYQAGMQARLAASVADFVIVEGFDG